MLLAADVALLRRNSRETKQYALLTRLANAAEQPK